MAGLFSKLFSGLDKGSNALLEQVASLKTKFDALKDKAGRAIDTASRFEQDAVRLRDEIDSLKVLCGQVAAASLAQKPAGTPFTEVAFDVFSTDGDDGILQHLLHHVSPPSQTFIELSSGDHTLRRTQFLTLKDRWRGLVLSRSSEAVERLRQQKLHWERDVTVTHSTMAADAVSTSAASAGLSGDIGLLNIHLEGMDYWAWQALSSVQPRMVACTFNSALDTAAKITVPFQPEFSRSEAHPSQLYYGASLAALEDLASQKGYVLVGINPAHSAAYFLRRDCLGAFPAYAATTAIQSAPTRPIPTEGGPPARVTSPEWRTLLATCPAHDLSSGRTMPLNEIWKAQG